jgi:hypothetical protein
MNDIQAEIRNVLEAMECADANEVDAHVLDAYLEELATQEAEKIDAYGYVLRQQVARIQFLKDEEKRVQNRRKAAENALDRMKSRMLHVMTANGLRKVSGATTTISLRKSASVVVDDVSLLSEQFVRIKTTTEPDKVAIKDAMLSGVDVAGARLVESESLQVK